MSALPLVRLVTAIALAGALVAVLLLHLVEPDLGITWAYAHLGRNGWLVALAVAAMLALPIAGATAWRSSWARAISPPASWRSAAIAGGAVFAILLLLGALWPAPALTFDSAYFKKAVAHPATPAARWFLAVEAARPVARALRAVGIGVDGAVIAVNAFWSAIGVLALAGCARLLARTRGEETLIAVLALTAFGTAQVAIGYIDVYPIALAAAAAFFWCALRALRGEMHPAAALAIAATAPFFYVGSLLLWSPALVLLALTVRRSGARGGARRALGALGAAAIAAGLATIPLRGRPFDWLHFLRLAAEGSAYQAGYLPDSSLLPLWYAASAHHLGEMASTIGLVDPIGALLVVVAGAALLVEERSAALDDATLVLGAFVAGWLAYLTTMDAVFGAFADWDLFATGAVGTSLLGGYVFVRWLRLADRERRARLSGAVAGLAVAVAATHLFARFHALPVDAERHVAESPLHILRPGDDSNPAGGDRERLIR